MAEGTFRSRLSEFVKERMNIARNVTQSLGNRARGEPVVFLNMEPFNFPTPGMGSDVGAAAKKAKIVNRRKLIGF